MKKLRQTSGVEEALLLKVGGVLHAVAVRNHAKRCAQLVLLGLPEAGCVLGNREIGHGLAPFCQKNYIVPVHIGRWGSCRLSR